jgi:hypothetical protein
MSQPRSAGYVGINGVPFAVVKDPKTNAFTYMRQSTPKKAVQSTRRNTSTGQSNMIEAKFQYTDGVGDESVNDTRDTMHYTMNLFTERQGEAVILPGMIAVVPDDDPSSTIADSNMIWNAPVFAWEQYGLLGDVQTYFLADHRAFNFRVRSGMTMTLDEDMYFEGSTRPTGGTTFGNLAYAAMGGGASNKDRYLRRRDPTTGVWTNDDNNQITYDSVANDTGAPKFHTTTAHGYSVGDVVFITPISSDSTNKYAGLWTISAVADTTHFTLGAAVWAATENGTVNLQDSDVMAEQLCIVGDEMVRTFYTTADGWQTSRVDIVGSNELLAANWTAGIGILNVGDKFSRPTALISTGEGELVMKPEGVFKYDVGRALYANEIPALASHRHPDNGRGSFEWKGWVYIPTIIGIYRWKSGIVQDVTPGRGGTQGFDTPIGPVAFMTGDADRLYAVIQPYQVNQPQTEAVTSKHYAYAQGGGFNTPTFVNESLVFDGDMTTADNLSSMAADGFIYVGSLREFHRINLKFAIPGDLVGGLNATGNAAVGGATLKVQLWCDTNGDGVGDAWVTKTIYYDGTRGWDNTDNDPCSLFQSGDIVFGPRTDAASGEDTWKNDAHKFGGSVNAVLTDGFYWARIGISAAVNGTVLLEEVDIGSHADNSFEPQMTTEIANDHGGVMYVLSMTEEQGRGVIWRHMWAVAVPDLTRNTGRVYGGPQRVGLAKIIQPQFSRAAQVGDRYLFIGLQNISYLCPLGNHPDPTSQPYNQFFPYTGAGIDNGTRPVIGVTPFTDFGLSIEPKVLKEIEFQSDGIDLSSVELWYAVDYGNWQFAGMADDCIPNLPFVFAGGTEPYGSYFAVAFCYEADSDTELRADRFFDLVIRAQPRPEMAETVRLSVILEYDQQLPGAIKRRSPSNSYADLVALQGAKTTIPFRNINGDTEYVHILQVSQHATLNTNDKPVLVADVILAVGTAQVLAP